MYRPQFAFPGSDVCDVQRFHYSYDKSNTPMLNSGTLAAGDHTGRIPLSMDQDDAPVFLLRAIQQKATGLQIRLETPHGEPISDSGNAVEQTNYVYPALFSEVDGAAFVALDGDACREGGIPCPRGGVLNLYLNNPTSNPIDMNTVVITLHGVKWYQGDRCR